MDEGNGFENWLEVDETVLTTAADPTLQYFALVDIGGIPHIRFGDGVNSKIPASGTDNLRATYVHSGDILTYTPEYPNRWKNDMGIRVILEHTPGSEPITDIILNKICKILETFKASYVIYKPIIVPSDQLITEEVPIAVDEYEDTIGVVGTIIHANVAGEQSNLQYYTSAIWPFGFTP